MQAAAPVNVAIVAPANVNFGKSPGVVRAHDDLDMTVEADQPGRLSDNAVTLVPGAPVTLSFTPDDPGARPQFTLRDLHAATYGA